MRGHGEELPRLHVVTDDAVLAHPDFLERAGAALAAGRREVALHLRGPGTHARRLFELAEALRAAAEAEGASLAVNERVDVALAAGVGWVHCPRRGFSPGVARALLEAYRADAHIPVRVGVSCHDPEEATRAKDAGADYLFVGSVYPTASHPGVPGGGAALVAGVHRALGGARVPLVAIGGVTPERVAELRNAGAHGVAVIRGVWAERDPHGAVLRYLEVLDREPRGHGSGDDDAGGGTSNSGRRCDD